jgi:hypothetical protein
MSTLHPRENAFALRTCGAINVTNLNFVELLLKEGADPKCSRLYKQTPLMRRYRMLLVRPNSF